MNILIITKSGGGAESLVASLRAAGHAVTISSGSPEVARHIREIPFGAIIVDSVSGAAADDFRRQVERVRPGCRILFVSNLEKSATHPRVFSTRPGEIGLQEQDLVALFAEASTPALPVGEERKVRALIQALDVVVSLIESDDPYFAGYSHRVAELVSEVAQRLNLGTNAQEEIEIAALLHDVGKVALESSLLLHAGPNVGQNALRMREHVQWGERLIEHIEFPWRVHDIVRHHHERYDGSGYPEGLQGRGIPIGARIIAAVDAYVAMVSHRRHRPALRGEEAREELTRSSGTQLDPEVVEALLRVVAERPTQPRGVRSRVAIIDPDPQFQQLLRLRRTTEGLDVDGRQTIDDAEPLLRMGEISLMLIDVTSGGVATGGEALSEMVGWCEGRFRINHGVAAPDRTIEGDTLSVLLEALRIRDEASHTT